MGTKVISYPSKSSPGKMYNIWLSDTGGAYYCDCWQWKKNKTCSHLENFLSLALRKGTVTATEMVKMKITKEENSDVDNVIDNIINNFFKV